MQADNRQAWTLLAVALLSVAGCSDESSSPEAEVRAWLAAAEAAAEERDRSALLDLLADSYADGRGNDKEAIGNMLRVYFFRQQSVSLLTRVEEIRVHGDSAAEVDMFVGMAGTTNTAFGIRADAYDFALELVKDDGDWLLIGARWGEAGGELH
ncbi:MAG: hypothetical protein OEW35_16030 [Gammaproteobacteria bacterium]|nr:hypothetical protein [Gammaproteobacteria bacterium]MDH4255829.1 hypothetical protein [Gammaproteobacteria bacterium]MDH5311530.1 hypothetical protein [Gammaproteobacteria bacterium]